MMPRVAPIALVTRIPIAKSFISFSSAGWVVQFNLTLSGFQSTRKHSVSLVLTDPVVSSTYKTIILQSTTKDKCNNSEQNQQLSTVAPFFSPLEYPTPRVWNAALPIECECSNEQSHHHPRGYESSSVTCRAGTPDPYSKDLS